MTTTRLYCIKRQQVLQVYFTNPVPIKRIIYEGRLGKQRFVCFRMH
jgi:hypothetical protein